MTSKLPKRTFSVAFSSAERSGSTAIRTAMFTMARRVEPSYFRADLRKTRLTWPSSKRPKNFRYGLGIAFRLQGRAAASASKVLAVEPVERSQASFFSQGRECVFSQCLPATGNRAVEFGSATRRQWRSDFLAESFKFAEQPGRAFVPGSGAGKLESLLQSSDGITFGFHLTDKVHRFSKRRLGSFVFALKPVQMGDLA